MKTNKYAPKPIDDIDVAFGGKVMEILPPYAEIPDEFKRHYHPWARWQSNWFFSGLKRYPKPKEGVDMQLALKNLAACQSSWEPKHEHKMAGVAYLASLWFDGPDGQEIKSEE